MPPISAGAARQSSQLTFWTISAARRRGNSCESGVFERGLHAAHHALNALLRKDRRKFIALRHDETDTLDHNVGDFERSLRSVDPKFQIDRRISFPSDFRLHDAFAASQRANARAFEGFALIVGELCRVNLRDVVAECLKILLL